MHARRALRRKSFWLILILFLLGFLGALVTAILLLAVKGHVGFLADRAFLIHSNHSRNELF